MHRASQREQHRDEPESEPVPSSRSALVQSPPSRLSNWFDLGGLAVQRSDMHHIVIIEGIWLRFRPFDYQVLLPLLTHFNCPVSVEAICRDALGCDYTDIETRRVYRAIDRLRPQLGAFGLLITSLNKKRGYMLWRGDPVSSAQVGTGSAEDPISR